MNCKLTIKTVLIYSVVCIAIAPGYPQKTANKPSLAPAVEFSINGGFYHHAVDVSLFAPGAAIYFTTDGSRPQPLPALRYRSSINVSKTTVIRAIAVIMGEKSRVYSQTFFINEPETTFPVISISITPSVLFDPVTGLFMQGANPVDTLWNMPGANFWSRKETSANFEFYETNGECVWHDEIGLRLFGGMSRLFPQKSLSIVARDVYGDNRLRYPFFGKSGPKNFKYLVLRNSGSDFGQTHFRDALMTHLVKGWDLDVQDYRPAHVYLNGRYWGIYNIREKINRYFIAGHHAVNKDSLDLIEHRLTRNTGSTHHYKQLLDFLKKNNLSNDANFTWVNSQMEVQNFMDLQIAQIYFDNQDAGGNIKFWRPQTPSGRWRWILYDTDWGFGLTDPKAYLNNSLTFHTEPNGPHWPNPPWSTFIFRKLLENKKFEHQFINRFADYLNTDLAGGCVVAEIDKFYQRLLPEMPRHLERWRLNEAKWHRCVGTLRTFALERPAYIRQFLMAKFETGNLRQVELEIDRGGKVIINENISIRDSFNGQYFEKIAIRLKAVPDVGYRFVRWKGTGLDSEDTNLTLELSKPLGPFQAVFEKYDHPLAGKIIINEVSCNNRQSGDWVELYNHSNERVNLGGWILADKRNVFRFPSYTIPPKGYVIVCEDSAKFFKVHPATKSLISGLSFGLNKRSETIQLFSPDAAAVDSMGYQLEPMDSVFTLNLLLPTLNNGDPENWEISLGAGSPASANAYYVISRIQGKREAWMQIGVALGVILLCLFILSQRTKWRI